MAEDREGQAGPRVVGVDVVVRIAQVLLDLLDAAVEVEIQTCVVEGAVLDLPVVTRIAQDAVVEGREGLGTWCGERVERAVAAALCNRPSRVPLGAMNGSNMGKASHQAVDATGTVQFQVPGGHYAAQQHDRPTAVFCLV